MAFIMLNKYLKALLSMHLMICLRKKPQAKILLVFMLNFLSVMCTFQLVPAKISTISTQVIQVICHIISNILHKEDPRSTQLLQQPKMSERPSKNGQKDCQMIAQQLQEKQ